jgi:sucrose phosphorylase
LPLYPSSGDGGFAPIKYTEVDAGLGDWEDVEELAKDYKLMLEFMVNHISPESHQFQDYLEHGDKSQYADMFVEWEDIWPEGDPSPEDLEKIHYRKPESPLLEVTLKDGSKKRLWSTFGDQQIDIAPLSKPGMQFMRESLSSLCQHGAALVRLDAFAYVTKKAGTPCYFLEPEIWDLLKAVDHMVHEPNSGLLCEVHEDYGINLKLAKEGYWVYDFALPLLILHAFKFQTARNLKHWMRTCPHRQFTVLDTHDGAGVDDISGLTEVCDVQELQRTIEEQIGEKYTTQKYFYDSKEMSYRGVPHQYNSTYYTACGCDPRRYLLARSIQMFTPGIPMIYYVGLLCGENDYEEAKRQGPRGLNRHRYTLEEAEKALQKPVVQALMKMITFRNKHKAFEGQVDVKGVKSPELLEVTWRDGPHHATLFANLKECTFHVEATKFEDTEGVNDIITLHLQDEDLSKPTDGPTIWDVEGDPRD